MDFWKVIYENVEKKTFISQKTYLYASHREFDSFMTFYFVHIVKGLFCL